MARNSCLEIRSAPAARRGRLLAGTRTRIPAGVFLVPTASTFSLGLRDIPSGRLAMADLGYGLCVMGLQIGGRFHPQTIVMIRPLSCRSSATNASAARRLGCARLLRFTTDASRFHQCLPRRHTGGLDSVAAVAHRPPCGHDHRGQLHSRPSPVRAAFSGQAGAPLYARLATTKPFGKPSEGLSQSVPANDGETFVAPLDSK